jgi:inhibitor of KinA sporulation pathway (predicted exonuclease)
MKLKNLLEQINYPKDILIVDVESTCWDDKKEQGSQKNEIIEVGYAPIKNGKVGGKGSVFIKPEHSTVGKFCTKLTTITPKDIESKGLNVKQAYSKLKKIFSGFKAWASYGHYDRNMLKKMFKLYGIPDFLPKKHIDLRGLFAKKILNSDNRQDAPSNPADAMKKIKMPFVGVNHRGDDDAYNIAKLYLRMINET